MTTKAVLLTVITIMHMFETLSTNVAKEFENKNNNNV